MTTLLLDVVVADGHLLVYATGEIDIETAPMLGACLDELAGLVVVDLAGVTFLDSSGIGAIVQARKMLSADGGKLRLRAPQPNVQHVLTLTGLDMRFESDDDAW